MKPTTLQIPLDWRRSSAASFGSSTARPAEYNQSVFFSLVLLLGARGGWLAGQMSLLHSTYGTLYILPREVRYRGGGGGGVVPLSIALIYLR